MKGNQVFSNFIWRFAERCGAQVVGLAVSLVLARLLQPDDYGMIALVTVFISILNVFVDSGFGNALIQKKEADDLDFSSVFYFNLLWCCCLYFVLFACAPLVSLFYQKPMLTAVVRVLGITILVSGLKNVQQAYVSRHMMFKRFFFATLGGTVGAAVVGITMAYLGFGIWALVAQQIFNTSVDALILWFTVPWRPQKHFSFERLKELFGYGWKLLVSALLDTVYTNIRSLVIGKIYTASSLAFYNQGEKLPNAVVGNINNSIDSVLLPAMSNEQANIGRVREMTRRAIKTSTYIIAPLMMGLAATAEGFVSLILTDKWLPCVFFLRIFCCTYIFYPIHTANLNAIKAVGRSDLFLKLEVWKKAVGMILLLSTIWISVEAMAYSCLIGSFFSQLINSWPNKKLLKYSYVEQLKDILPGILLAVFMGVCIYPITFLGLHRVLILMIQIMAGAGIYILGSLVFKFDSFEYLTGVLKSMFFRRE